MLCKPRIALWALAVLALALAGCGGSGHGTSSTGPTETGNVLGTINPASAASGSGTVTVSLDGANVTTQTAANGSFTLPNVPAGVYTLVAQSGNSAADISVVVSGGASTNIGEVNLVASGQVAGVVTDSSTSNPIGGALVTVTDTTTSSTATTPPHPVRLAITDPTGGYSVDGLPAGTYLVTISKYGYTSGTLDITITAGATANGDIALTPAPVSAGTVSGTVTEQNSDGSTSPLAGVFVVLYSPTAVGTPMATPPTAIGPGKSTVTLFSVPPGFHEYYAYTASDGTYTINGVPAGPYTAYAIRPGFQSSNQSITVTANQTTTANFTLTLLAVTTGTITGQVTDASTGNPIAGANVTAVIYGPTPVTGSGGSSGSSGSSTTPPPPTVALPNVQSSFLLSTTTDSNGDYTLTVPTATAAVACNAAGYIPQVQAVTVAAGATVTANFSMAAIPNTTVTLSGVVSETVSGTTSPVSGATVTLTGASGILDPAVGSATKTYTATTDANGNYSFTVPAGYYLLSASATGGWIYSGQLLQLLASTTQNITLQQITVPPPVPVSNG